MRRFLFAAFAMLVLHPVAVRADEGTIQWRDFSDQVFAEAKRDNKFVVLYLKAVWCHWCHVMEGTTYRDPEVRATMAKSYIPVRVDQDSRPDLSLPWLTSRNRRPEPLATQLR